MYRFTVAILLVFGATLSFADSPAKARVPIPSWDDFPEGIFFDDALVEGLTGPRPSVLDTNATTRDAVDNSRREIAPELKRAVGSTWTKVISMTTIENEFKAIKIEIDRIVTTPSKFRGGGFQEARVQFSVATLLFGIVAEYGTETKWQTYAGGARDLFARAAANSKVGDIRAYNEAKQRKADLHDLVSGARISPPTANPDATWEQLLNRSPLMERLEVAQQERLTVWTSSPSEFEKNADRIVREAELVAAIAHVLKQDGMEDAGDDSYNAYSDAMKTAARQLIESVRIKNPEKARSAAAAIGQACSQCHEDYRG